MLSHMTHSLHCSLHPKCMSTPTLSAHNCASDKTAPMKLNQRNRAAFYYVQPTNTKKQVNQLTK